MTTESSERLATEQTSAPRSKASAAGPRLRNVLIVGAGERGRALAGEIRDHPEYRLNLVGFVDDDQTKPAGINGYKMLGDTRSIMGLIKEHAIDEILISYTESLGDRLLNNLRLSGQEHSVLVKVLPTLYEAIISKIPLQTINDIPFFQVNGKRPTFGHSIGKRLTDLLLASVLLLLAGPVLVVCALIIRFSSHGPVMFRQRRLGLHGVEFTVYKLRTMIEGAEADTGPVLSTDDDQRVTRFGRFLRDKHLDELPQLFNVLRGEMSMVGPRPERPEFVTHHARRVSGYLKRLEVKPGLTGLAQVCGGYNTDIYDKMKYDWTYIYHRTFLLDLKIVWLTFALVVWPAKKARIRKGSPLNAALLAHVGPQALETQPSDGSGDVDHRW